MFCQWLKVSICVLLLGLFVSSTARGERDSQQVGITGRLSGREYHHVSTKLAERQPIVQGMATRTMIRPEVLPSGREGFSLDEWTLLESISRSASIPSGMHYAFRLDLANQSMVEVPPQNNLSELCLQAVERAPSWLRNDLIDNLLQFGGWESLTDAIAEIILNAQDPYVDEVAFTLAHLSPDLLIHDQMDLDRDLGLVLENVEGVYAADMFLDYVQINDYGSSVDDDYWSTAEYSIATEAGDTVQIEVDRDVYYWYVMHPRISDEVPMYIDPATGDSAAPPIGKFWRDFYLYEPDDGYVSLHDMLDSCAIMYGNLFNDSTDANGAVGIVTRWIPDVMDFGSGVERPIQPVRIYRLHLGRCGEHQDITAAAARAALIPAVGATAICNDHVWNEFWDGTRWKSWEPVNNYVGDSLAYEGWGKHFPAVFDWRADGFVWTVTQRYHSNTTTLTVHILQENDNPVDGAKVKVLSDYEYGGLKLATCGYTDATGTVSFTIGGQRDIYLNISSPLGMYPSDPDGGVLVIEDSDPNVEYEWTYNYDGGMATVEPEEAEPPQDPLDHFHLTVQYDMLCEATHGQIFRYSDFVAEIGDARVDFFICDEQNYNRFAAWMDFEAFAIADLMGSGQIDFTLPTDGTWYAVLSNVNSISDYHRAEMTANLYVDDEFAVVRESEEVPNVYMLYPNYPNPFNSATALEFSVPRASEVTVHVYDILGRQVATLSDGWFTAGRHRVLWDCRQCASGVYLVVMSAQGHDFVRKAMLLK